MLRRGAVIIGAGWCGDDEKLGLVLVLVLVSVRVRVFLWRLPSTPRTPGTIVWSIISSIECKDGYSGCVSKHIFRECTIDGRIHLKVRVCVCACVMCVCVVWCVCCVRVCVYVCVRARIPF